VTSLLIPRSITKLVSTNNFKNQEYLNSFFFVFSPLFFFFFLPDPEKLATAENYRNEGNEYFKKGENKNAMGAYHRALMYLKVDLSPSSLN